jgi:hypothetical protein
MMITGHGRLAPLVTGATRALARGCAATSSIAALLALIATPSIGP